MIKLWRQHIVTKKLLETMPEVIDHIRNANHIPFEAVVYKTFLKVVEDGYSQVLDYENCDMVSLTWEWEANDN